MIDRVRKYLKGNGVLVFMSVMYFVFGSLLHGVLFGIILTTSMYSLLYLFNKYRVN